MTVDEFVNEWMKLFNDDRERLVTELYAEDCVVEVPSWGVRLEGREAITAMTRKVAADMPDRRLLGTHRVLACADGASVVIEARMRSGGEEYDTCTILDLRDGLVVRDRSYR